MKGEVQQKFYIYPNPADRQITLKYIPGKETIRDIRFNIKIIPVGKKEIYYCSLLAFGLFCTRLSTLKNLAGSNKTLPLFQTVKETEYVNQDARSLIIVQVVRCQF
jgi:hypothetical protein